MPVQNFLVSNCSMLVSSYSYNRMYLQGGVKLKWNLDFTFLESSFSQMLHNFISSARSSVRRTVHIPCINVCSLCAISCLYIPVEHELAYCSCFKYFQLELRKEIWFSVLTSCVLYCLYVNPTAFEPWWLLDDPCIINDPCLHSTGAKPLWLKLTFVASWCCFLKLLWN